MYCSNCGKQNEQHAKFCNSCGKPLSMEEQSIASPTQSARFELEEGRSTIILIFGILSLVLLGPFLGIPAWVMGHTDLKKIKAGIIAETHKSTTKAGMILGIIGTLLIPVIILIGIAIAVGITMFQDNDVSKNRDVVANNLVALSSKAVRNYTTPIELYRGRNSFVCIIDISVLVSPSLSDNRIGPCTIRSNGTKNIIRQKQLLSS